MSFIYIALFGLLGIFSRYAFGLWIGKIFPWSFPMGTLLINILGSFLIGIVYALGQEKLVLSRELTLGLIVGLLGGFTTFSSYSLDLLRMIERREYLSALIYFNLSTLCGLGAVFSGAFLVRMKL